MPHLSATGKSALPNQAGLDLELLLELPVLAEISDALFGDRAVPGDGEGVGVADGTGLGLDPALASWPFC